jgi:hypothetical protein
MAVAALAGMVGGAALVTVDAFASGVDVTPPHPTSIRLTEASVTSENNFVIALSTRHVRVWFHINKKGVQQTLHPRFFR